MVKRFYIYSIVGMTEFYEKDDTMTLIKDFKNIIEENKEKNPCYRAIGIEIENDLVLAFDLIISKDGKLKVSNDIKYTLSNLEDRDKIEVITYANEIIFKAKECMDICLGNWLTA